MSYRRLGTIAGLVLAFVAGLHVAKKTSVSAESSRSALVDPQSTGSRQHHPPGSSAEPTVTLPDFRTVARRAVPSVVTVRSERTIEVSGRRSPSGGGFFERFFGTPRDRDGGGGREYTQRGLGSGVVVNGGSYILTNNHVVDGVDMVEVVDYEGDVYKAEIIGTDPKTDLAVLKVGDVGLQPIRLGDSSLVEVGEWVLAIGNPFDEELSATVTAGIVSAKGRSNLNLTRYENFIQTDAAINPGNSGGALVNVRGELIGINTAIVSRSGGYQGIGFAIPVEMAENIMEQLIDSGRVSRGYIGVGIQSLDRNVAEGMGLDDDDGVLVTQVQTGTPAEEAGLESGDVIVSLDGQPIADAADLSNRVAGKAPGTRINLTIVRRGRERTLRFRLAELPPDDDQRPVLRRGDRDGQVDSEIGCRVQPLTADIAEKLGYKGRSGVVVSGVEPGSAAAEAGLRRGDLVSELTIAGRARRIRDLDDYREALAEAESGKVVLFRIRRGGSVAYLAVRP